MKLLRQLRALFYRETLDTEMSEEMRTHLELLTAENMKRGMDPDEARYAAQREFGGVEQIKERVREARGWTWLEQLRQDIRFAGRMLAKAPGFTSVAVLTLALGIGVNTAVFSVVYGVLLAPYPYAKSGEMWSPDLLATTTGRHWSFRTADYLEMVKLPAVRSAMATTQGSSLLGGGVNPEIINTPRVTGTAFEFLGVPAVLGRGFSPVDFSPSGDPQPVAVLSFAFWQSHFNGDRAALGQTLLLDDQHLTIIGVMPPRFTWYGADVWLPLATTDLQRGTRPLVRLQPGTTPSAASEQLFALIRAQAAATPGPYPKDGFNASFVNYLDQTVASGEMRTSLQLLIVAVAFLLLIACTNVANLQLARGAARSREMAVRLAIGASRGRLFRQLLTESLALALVGGALGVFFAFGFTKVIVALMPDFYVPSEARVTLNGWVLLFTAVISIVTGILFGLAPGIQCTRPALTNALKDGGQSGAGSVAAHRTRNVLVIVQVSLAIVLLVGASLAIRGFVELQRVDRGFRAERLVMVRVPLAAKRYVTVEQRNNFTRDLLERFRRIPGSASATLGALPGYESGSGVTIAGQPKIQDGVQLNFVDTDYLSTLGITLRAGRNFTPQEVASHAPVAIVSEAMAKLWADGQSPLGRSVSIDSLVGGGTNILAPRDATRDVTVIGIVSDVRTNDRRRPANPVALVPYTLRAPLNRAFIVRSANDPVGIVKSIRHELRDIDPTQLMLDPVIVEKLLDRQVMQPRFNLALFAALAAVALSLAAAGIYSMLSYHVAQRTREIGVRLALGAGRGDILQMIMAAGARLLVVGVVVGLVTSIALGRWVRSEVFNVPPFDPVALVVAALTLSAAALFACWWPARRATKVDPMTALRAE